MGFLKQVYQGKNDYWRWLIVLVVILSPYFFDLFEYLFNYKEQLAVVNQLKEYKGNSNFLLANSLVGYVFLLVLLFLAIKFIHKIKIKTLFTANKHIDFKKILLGFFTFGIFITAVVLAEYFLTSQNLVFQYKREAFFQLLAIALFLIPIKVIFQETFFRGYLIQGIGLVSNSRWMSIAFTALIFGGIFSLRAETDTLDFNLLFFYLISDIFLGIIVLMDEGNELTIGIQWMSNFIPYVIITSEWMVFKTDALFYDPSKEPNYLFSLYVIIFLVYPLYLLFLARIYGWKNWLEKLFGKIRDSKKA